VRAGGAGCDEPVAVASEARVGDARGPRRAGGVWEPEPEREAERT
jgi:hypothetical protein